MGWSKLFVFSLALPPGSQARHLLQHDDAQSYWDQIKDLAITYAETLKNGGRDQVAQLEASGVAKQLK